MSQNNFKIIANDSIQPKEFCFNSQNLIKAKDIIKIYPKNFKESSIMPLLTIAQNQNNGWIPKKAIEYISQFINVPEIKVLELATFYSMYNLSPVGKYHIEVCTTTPCMLRGSDSILSLCKKKLGINIGEISKDKNFSLDKIECLGACVNGPVAKINENYFEDLDSQNLELLIQNLKKNKNVKVGSQSKRKKLEVLK
ncbi:MAG: NADH-quinone oxidoreductase subunit NuoE [Pseudomonadota bacterium]|nr:NADH-quinone oxidoreductase subunit NuoE [Pseudomonadota bacterium]